MKNPKPRNDQIRLASCIAVVAAVLGALGVGGCSDSFSTDCSLSKTCAPEDRVSASGGSSSEGSGDSGPDASDSSTSGGSVGSGTQDEASGGTTGSTEKTVDPCDACETPTSVCNDAEECVECTEDEHCSASSPFCVAEQCVVCEGNPDCKDAEAARCINNACVGCSTYGDCAHLPSTPVCNVSTGTCRSCTGDTDCDHLRETRVCNQSTGACIQCDKDTEADQCGEYSCSTLTNECTSTKPATLGTCEPCESDSQCRTGRQCVLHYFQETELGYFCTRERDVFGCGSTGGGAAPYSRVLTTHSLDGPEQDFCTTFSTCKALEDSESQACGSSDDCGEKGLEDAVCPSQGSTPGMCASICSVSSDCSPGDSCTGTPRHCE